nr:unnamed protein product [Callosobruchus chinensis]
MYQPNCFFSPQSGHSLCIKNRTIRQPLCPKQPTYFP